MEMRKHLESFIGKDEIVSVFCNPNDEYSAVVGFVEQVDDDYFILREVHFNGMYDGYVLRKTDEIFRIDYQSHYEHSMKKLYNINEQSHLPVTAGDNPLFALLCFATERNFVISVGIRDNSEYSVSGFIDSCNFETKVMIIHTINKNNGAFDGFTVVAFDAIARLRCDNEDDRSYQQLNTLYYQEPKT